MNVSSTFKLNNGNEIPVMALGSWDSRGDEAYQACLDALSSGYRHIDTAAYYENEAAVDAALKAAKTPEEVLKIAHDLEQRMAPHHWTQKAWDRYRSMI